MSEHKAKIEWERKTDGFGYKEYDRSHKWVFEHGAEVAASAAPKYLGNPELVDPEEAFVASLSACHMLTFLAIASYKGLIVDRYVDDAIGFMEKNADGRLAITRVTLRPDIVFGGDTAPSPDELEVLHEKSHHACFIANSVTTDITVETV